GEHALDSPAVFALGAAMDRDDGFRTADEVAELLDEVVERVAVLSEHDELATAAVGLAQRRLVVEQRGELLPLPVLAGASDFEGEAFESLEHPQLGLELVNGARGRGLVDDLFLELLELGIVEIVEGVGVVVAVELPE